MVTSTRQANFLLPEDLLDELKKNVPRREQSKVVAEALMKELKRLKLKRALKESFGAWKDEDHRSLVRLSQLQRFMQVYEIKEKKRQNYF